MKKYDRAVGALRLISILGVILIHTTTRILETVNYNLGSFPFSLFLNQISRFAVPLFFALSGFVLELNYQNHDSFLSYLKKRFGRIFIPYVFWSGIYYLFIYNQNQDNFLKVLLTGNASYQLYFIPALCVFYLLFPFLHKVYKYLSNKWAVIILLILQVYLLRLDYYSGGFEIAEPLRIAFLAFFVFILGMIASHNKERILNMTKKAKLLLPTLTVLSGLYVYWEGKVRYFATYNIHAFYSQWRPSVFLFTVLIGIFLYSFFGQEKYQLRIINTLSRLSYLVFFVHVIVLETVWIMLGKSIFNSIGNSFVEKVIFDLLFFGVITTLSFFISFVIHKIPKLDKITG